MAVGYQRWSSIVGGGGVKAFQQSEGSINRRLEVGPVVDVYVTAMEEEEEGERGGDVREMRKLIKRGE